MDASPVAPGVLELVRQFVNTREAREDTDALSDSRSWHVWAQGTDYQADATTEDLARLRRLRETLRDGLFANHDRTPLPEPVRAALQDALAWSAAQPRMEADGLHLTVTATGPARVAGDVAAAVATALADGTWSRLKACRDDTCMWAFYDTSRSRTGQWCSMQGCGNRNKQARWRDRHDTDEQPKP